MGRIGRLIYGSDTLDINDKTVYSLMPDFIPPGPARAINFAAGTFRNKRGGKVTGRQPKDRYWAFSVKCMGASEAETHNAANRLQWFLDLCDPDIGGGQETLYFEYAPSDAVSYNPLWGQIVYRYEIKDSPLAPDDRYSIATLSSQAIVLTATMLVGPHAEGLKQCLGSALGGVMEDTVGMVDGRSRGLRIPVATPTGGNQFTNPIFGSSTWSSGWTAGAQITAAQNTNKEFVLFGNSSARLTRIGTPNCSYTQTINVASTLDFTLSFYCKLSTGGVITSAKIVAYYNDLDRTTTFTAVGNGWYRGQATFAGVNAAATAGVNIKTDDITIYVDGFQLERLAYSTPLCYGDMLGCAWTSTAHASSSTRTGGRLRLPTSQVLANPSYGTIRFAWKTDYANTHSAAMVFFDIANGATLRLSAYFDNTDDKIYFQDGGESLGSTSSVTFGAGDWLIFHFIWSPGGKFIFLNGALIGSSGNFTAWPSADYIWIGTNRTPDTQAGGVFRELLIYDESFTTAQVAADYANLGQAIANDGAMSTIPWLWTKDGDDQVDNCDDSTHDNWCVCGGIPGSDDAITDINAGFGVAPTVLYVGNHLDPLDDWLIPGDRWNQDGQGTVEGNSIGGQYQSVSLPDAVAPRTEIGSADKTITAPDNINGPFHFFFRCKLTTGSATVLAGYFLRLNDVYLSSKQDTNLAVNTNYMLYYLGRLDLDRRDIYPIVTGKVLKWGVNFDSASTVTLWADFAQVINGRVAKYTMGATQPPGGGAVASIPGAIRFQGTDVALDGTYSHTFNGEIIELTPGFYNTLFFWWLLDTPEHVLTHTANLTAYITPRWTLL